MKDDLAILIDERNNLREENLKLKDINKQLMEEIQWENRLNSKLSKELLDLKELILKTINIFEIALELKEVKSK